MAHARLSDRVHLADFVRVRVELDQGAPVDQRRIPAKGRDLIKGLANGNHDIRVFLDVAFGGAVPQHADATNKRAGPLIDGGLRCQIGRNRDRELLSEQLDLPSAPRQHGPFANQQHGRSRRGDQLRNPRDSFLIDRTWVDETVLLRVQSLVFDLLMKDVGREDQVRGPWTP